jgi:hypothetical protein
MKITPFLFKWIRKYCHENLEISMELYHILKWNGHSRVHIIKGNSRPYEADASYGVAWGFSEIKVGEEWLKENLSAEDKAKIIAERILQKPEYESLYNGYSSVHPFNYYPWKPTTVDECKRKFDVDYVAKIINP